MPIKPRRLCLTGLLAALGIFQVAEARDSAATPPSEAPEEKAATEIAPPELPEEVRVGVPTELAVPGDKPVLVIHGPADSRRAIIYLHGMCGNVRAVDSWKEAVTRHGTLIGILGDRACGSGRFRWTKQVELIERRIEQALDAVRDARGGLLDSSERILFGYSQGADRSALLARRYPNKYRRVVLGGPSHRPALVNLGDTDAVAVFGGELETTWHMRTGAEVLSAAGKPARFFLLPSAKHGEYGPEGRRVIGEVLEWVVGGVDEG